MQDESEGSKDADLSSEYSISLATRGIKKNCQFQDLN
jgi:hypothetical protein